MAMSTLSERPCSVEGSLEGVGEGDGTGACSSSCSSSCSVPALCAEARTAPASVSLHTHWPSAAPL